MFFLVIFHFSLFKFNMINIIAWNCRGAGARFFPRLIREIKEKYNLDVMILVESRVSGRRVDNIITKLGFQNSYRVEAEGFSGGIRLLWEGDNVKINIIRTSNQLIHNKVSFNKGEESFFLTCVYGNPIPSIRQELWNQLMSLSYLVGDQKWSCIGDFNAYKGVEDKQGVAGPNVKSINDFKDCCTNCNLMDLNFCGPRFT